MGGAGSDPKATDSDSQSQYLKTSFLDALAHELRGPSGVTLGALDELELSLGDAAKEHARLFAMARRGIKRVLRTADRLSRSSQLEQGGLAPLAQPVSLNTLVEQSVREAELVEGRRGVTVTVKPAASEPQVNADPEWLTAALTELCGYALRSARRSVRVEIADAADVAQVIVCDDGAATSVPRMRRFEATTDRRDAALAYPMIHDVIVAHGGELSVRPGDDTGLLSVLSLPKA